MPYHCIPLTDKEYKLTLKRVLEHPTKSQKYAQFKEKYELVIKAIKQLESLGPHEHLPAILDPLKASQKECQEGMAKLLDSEYRAMQKEARK
jgi:hypothetical protein